MNWSAITALMDSDEFVPDPPFPMGKPGTIDPNDPDPDPIPDPPVEGGEEENPETSG